MKRVVVYHARYGCDSGCCGHIIELQDVHGDVERSNFLFAHPGDEGAKEWARELVAKELGAEHVADLDWDKCVVVDD